MSAFEFEGHEALVAALRAGTLGAPDYLHRRVLAGAPARRRRTRSMSTRQRFFIAVPVALGMAILAAAVNGVFFSSSSHQTPFNAAGRTSHGLPGPVGGNFSTGANGATGHNGATGATGPTGAPGPTGAKGPTGLRGATGAAGATGANGATGAYREAGRHARRGLTGPTGAGGGTGAAGHTGPTSANGKTYFGDQASTLGARQNAQLNAAAAQSALPNAGFVLPKGRLTHAAANLQVEVSDCGALTTATNQASAIVSQLGGYTQSVQYRASQHCSGNAYLILHVPLGKTETAITKLGGLGQLVSQSVSTQDLQQTFKKQTSKISLLQRQIAAYEHALASGTLTSSQQAQTQAKLTEAKRLLTGTRKARIHTVKSGTTSDIRLLLSTKHQAALFTGPHKTGRLGQMLHNMIQFLAVEGIVVLYILLIAGPILLIGGLIWWFTLGRKRRDEKELLAQGA